VGSADRFAVNALLGWGVAATASTVQERTTVTPIDIDAERADCAPASSGALAASAQATSVAR
jgi:hypothetical protein